MGWDARIILDNEYNTYYAGQTLNGRVEYEFDTPKKVRGIHVTFKGEANTAWSEKREELNNPHSNQTATYDDQDRLHTGHEEYFSIMYYILGSASGDEIEIPAGRNSYNITCALPPALPSSFEHQYGHVRYTIKVTADRPWKFDHTTKMAFTVINPLDLNLNNSYKQPIHLQMEKRFCCLWCASQPLSVDARAPVSGYCPGQLIPITVDVENKSNVQVHLVKVALRRVVTFRSQTPVPATKVTKDVVTQIQEGPAPAGTTKHWDIRLEVPAIPPSNLVNCGIIDLDYDLSVECKVSGLHRNLHGKSYVTIGTVPLVGQPTLPTAPYRVECKVSGLHRNLHGKSYVTIGTVPLVGQSTLPTAPPLADNSPAVLPVSPGKPEPAYNGGGDTAGGWTVPGAPPPYQSLYPTLSQPVYKAAAYSAHTIQDRGDNKENTRVVGPNFAPFYPTYNSVQPPPLPQ